MKKENNFKLKDLWQIFLLVALPIICVGGASAFPFILRQPLIYLTGIFFVFMFIFSDIKIYLNSVTISAFLFLAFVAVSIFYSYDRASTLNLLLIYACAFTLLFLDLPAARYSKILTVMYVICIVIAFSIILSAVVENCMLKYFKFIVNPLNTPSVTQSIRNELAIGTYSGFAREKTEAAYILNVGIAISFAKYFSSGKLAKKDLFFLGVFLVALMLTGKRTLFIICIVCFAVFMIVSKMRSKVFTAACIILIALGALFILIMFVPKAANIFNRFMDSENLETLGKRDMLWGFLYRMIADCWQFGAGFDSFNKYTSVHGMKVGNKDWQYNGHNSYLQAFGELGIIGSAFLVIFVVSALVLSFKVLKKISADKDNSYPMFFSLYIQLMMLIYGVTGNPIYSKQIVFCWFFAIGIMLSLYTGKCRPDSRLEKRSIIKYE